jgi:hypothetical protein
MQTQNDPVLAPQYTVFGPALGVDSTAMRLRLSDMNPKNAKTLARSMPLSFAEKAQSVIKEAIKRMPTGRWYFVPTTNIEGKRPDCICQGFGMEFNVIAPIFLHASRCDVYVYNIIRNF